ncbi:MAG: PorT family protein [Dysgonamonadaceae bacterium]|jgi:hypothetical protein|nr:PorT family protein [Dysgonamonadaceae bacterium]
MKQLFKLSIACAFLSVALVSQAQVKYGVKGGLNVSTLSGYADVVDTKQKPGFHVGVVSQVNFPSRVFIQPELLFSKEGIKAKWFRKYTSRSLNYLQLPVYIGYKIDAGWGLNIIAGAGPYLACGVGGTDKPFKDIYRRFDAGLSGMGGIQFEGFQLTLGYDLGLCDQHKSAFKRVTPYSRTANRNLKVSLAYLF